MGPGLGLLGSKSYLAKGNQDGGWREGGKSPREESLGLRPGLGVGREVGEVGQGPGLLSL